MKRNTSTVAVSSTVAPASAPAPVQSELERMLAQFSWGDIQAAKLAQDLANLEPKKEKVKTTLGELLTLVEEIQGVDKSYIAPFVIPRLERTPENLVAVVTATPNIGRTDLIRKFSGGNKVVGDFVDKNVKDKTIDETKGKNAKNQETFSYSLPS